MSKARELSVVPTQSLGFKNRIINGDCRIDQRNAGAAFTVLQIAGNQSIYQSSANSAVTSATIDTSGAEL